MKSIDFLDRVHLFLRVKRHIITNEYLEFLKFIIYHVYDIISVG